MLLTQSGLGRGERDLPSQGPALLIDDLLDIRIFVRVAATGSFSSAARELDLSLAVVSKRLAALEKRLGVTLIRRNTRNQSLTTDGRVFHERAVRILAEVQAAEDFIAGAQETVSGLLTITAPRTFGRQYLVPLVTEFQSLHPQLSVKLLLSDDVVDLTEGGIDLAFRFGSLVDSTMSARHIASNYRVMCASPAYIRRAGIPTKLSDLLQHSCIVYGARPAAHWLFHVGAKPTAAEIRGTFLVSDGETALALALEGAGILLKSIWDVGKHIEQGQLVRVMPDFTAPTEPLHAVFPHGRQLARRVRNFIDFSVERLRSEWRWEVTPTQSRAPMSRRKDATVPAKGQAVRMMPSQLR